MAAVIEPISASSAADYEDEIGENESEQLFNRPPRILRQLPREEITIPAPPQSTMTPLPMQLTMIVLPLATALLYIIVMIARGGQGGSIWLSLPIIVISLISSGFGIYNYVRQRRIREQTVQQQENTYNEALQIIRHRLVKLHQIQRETRYANDPDLIVLKQIVQSEPDANGYYQPQPRLWERRPADNDFLVLRIGRGKLPTTITIKPPQIDLLHFTPMLRRALDLANEFAYVHDVPMTVDLRKRGALGIAGPSGKVIEFTRALLWQIVVHHSPKEVRIVGFWDSRFDSSWEWLRWLPHTRTLDDDEDYRLLAHFDGTTAHLQQVVNVINQEMRQRTDQPHSIGSRPHLVLVLGDYHRYARTVPDFADILRHATSIGLSALCLVDEMRQVPGECGGYIDLSNPPQLALTGLDGGYFQLETQGIDQRSSNQLARQLAPIAQAEADGRRELPRTVRLLPLLEIMDAKAYNPRTFWDDVPEHSWHPVPCGLQSATEKLEINLNEGFDGVHGMIAGTTGSGKSEFLLTFLLTLAIKHSPDRVNFMLIDFKGGATFQGLEALPHTAGIVTDLTGNLAERALIAINSELDRRKTRLAQVRQRSASQDVSNIREYRKQGFEQHPEFGPMPNLLIAIDEFDEMVRDYPDFVTELVRVAKQGRSLGVHLLFATQQPSAIKEGLIRNLTYWIALRVTGTDDSKMMLTIPDAAYLTTATPGRGFFRVNRRIVQFQSARITLPYQPPENSNNPLRSIDVTGRGKAISRQERGVERLRQTVSSLLLEAVSSQSKPIDQLVDTFLKTYDQLATDRMLPHTQHELAETELRLNVGKIFENHLNSRVQALVDQDAEVDTLIDQLLQTLHGEQVQEQELPLIIQAMTADPTTGKAYASKHYPIWAEPLKNEIRLIDLLAANRVQADRWLQVVVGLLDLPKTAEQKPFLLDLANRDGNILVLGSAGSGKTTFLRTLLLSLAQSHSPAELWLYIIDPIGFGCGLVLPASKHAATMERQRKLLHIADAFPPQANDKVERLIIELQNQINQRLALLRDSGVDNLAQYRKQAIALGKADVPPAILIVIDNVAEFTAAQTEALDTFKMLMKDARKCGINFVITGYNWREVSSLQNNFETRIAFRLNDPTDSDAAIDKSFAARISSEQPGRGYLRTSQGAIELHIALPELRTVDMTEQDSSVDAESTPGRFVTDLEASIQIISEQYHQVTEGLPTELRSLRNRIELMDILGEQLEVREHFRLPIGIDSLHLQPLVLDFAVKTPHLIIAGGPQTGKSQLIRTIITGLAASYTPEEVQFVLVDYRRRVLEPFEQLPHVRTIQVKTPPSGTTPAQEREIRIVTDDQEVKDLVKDLETEMQQRRTSRRAQPRIMLIIHNWDNMQDTNAFWKPLVPFLRNARDVGLHLIITGTEYNNFTGTDILKVARQERCLIYLGHIIENSSLITNFSTKFPRQLAQMNMPAGRGYILLQHQWHLVQFALAPATLPLPTSNISSPAALSED